MKNLNICVKGNSRRLNAGVESNQTVEKEENRSMTIFILTWHFCVLSGRQNYLEKSLTNSFGRQITETPWLKPFWREYCKRGLTGKRKIKKNKLVYLGGQGCRLQTLCR